MDSQGEELARMSIEEAVEPNVVHGNMRREDQVASDGIQHGYLIVPSEERLLFLYSLLRRYKSKKVVVIFSSCQSVRFHSYLFRILDTENCFRIHEQQSQKKSACALAGFSKADAGVLLCTNNAAPRLDIYADWFVQYDPPNDPKDYVLRVGRTTSGEGAKENFLLVLIPQELKFIRYYQAEKVPVKEWDIKPMRLETMQRLVTLVSCCWLKEYAEDAYRCYLLAYNSLRVKDVFDVQRLDMTAVAMSFGLPAREQWEQE